LFPKKISNGAWEITITDQFAKACESIDEAVILVKKHLSTLEKEIESIPIPSIDSKEMRNLEKHVIRIGYEFAKTGKIPKELLIHGDDNLRPDTILQERFALQQNNNITPERMERMLAEPGATRPDEINNIPDSLDVHMREQLDRNANRLAKKLHGMPVSKKLSL
jgi:hypothetical protein